MTPTDESSNVTAHHATHPLTDEQLAAFEQGWAVVIMPVPDGWRIRYVSANVFADEPGTTFEAINEALAAIQEVLPAVNTPEARARASRERKQRHPL